MENKEKAIYSNNLEVLELEGALGGSPAVISSENSNFQITSSLAGASCIAGPATPRNTRGSSLPSSNISWK